MPTKGSVALKSLQTLLRILQFLGALLVLGIFSYFLARLAANDLPKARYVVAVEIIAAIAVAYTFLAVLLTFFVGGFTIFGALAVLFDLLLLGGFVAVTVLTRRSRRRCRGFQDTPLGVGNVPATTSDITNGFGYGNEVGRTYRPNIGRACQLQRAVFITSIVLIGLFLLTAIVQMLLVRQHKKDKRYGPSPANDYTSGKPKRGLFARKPKHDTTRDAELATVGAAPTVPVVEKHHNNNNNHMRPSHDTAYTGSTVAPADPYGVHNKPGVQSTIPTANTTNPGFSGPAPHGVGPLHNYATTGTTTNY